jgi:hypothetical protein
MPGRFGGKKQMRRIFNEATTIILIFHVLYLINVAGPNIKEILVKGLSHSRLINVNSIALLEQCD